MEIKQRYSKSKRKQISKVLCLIPKNKINKFQSLTRISYTDVTDFNNYMPYDSAITPLEACMFQPLKVHMHLIAEKRIIPIAVGAE